MKIIIAEAIAFDSPAITSGRIAIGDVASRDLFCSTTCAESVHAGTGPAVTVVDSTWDAIGEGERILDVAETGGYFCGIRVRVAPDAVLEDETPRTCDAPACTVWMAP